jgi:hypothetical protein
MTFPRRWSSALALFSLVFLLPAFATLALERAASRRSVEPVHFRDAQTQAAEFIGYWKSISLTREQEALKKNVLEKIPAPCCSDYSIATCCCPCNLAKSVWGLSNYLVAEKNADAATVDRTVRGWLRFVNANGFSGNICYSPGGCARPFAKNGCGGMHETQLAAR